MMHPDGSGTSGYVEGMCFGDGKFVVVGDGIAIRSTNGINWNVAHLSGKPILYGIAYADSKFVALGYTVGSGQGVVFTSSDAIT
jgi:hypothetical protein